MKQGSKCQSGLNLGIFTFWPVFGNRSYRCIFDPIFSDTGHTDLESEITSFAGRKTGLIIPYWLADRRSDGLGEGGKREKGLFWGNCFFRRRFQKGGIEKQMKMDTHPEGNTYPRIS